MVSLFTGPFGRRLQLRALCCVNVMLRGFSAFVPGTMAMLRGLCCSLDVRLPILGIMARYARVALTAAAAADAEPTSANATTFPS